MALHSDIDHTGIPGVGGGGVMAATSYKRSTGNYSTTSTSFVDVDGTNMSLTITTGARRVLIGFVGSVSGAGASYVMFDVTVDGTRQGGDNGLASQEFSGTSYQNPSFTYLTAPLSAGSHTFKLQYKVAGSTVTLHGAATGTPQCQFYVIEQPTA